MRRLRTSLKKMVSGLFILCVVPLVASCSRGAPERPTAHQILMTYLDHPASSSAPYDSELVVWTVEWSPKPLSAAERSALASIDVARIRTHWPDPKLRRVTIVFERLRRLGPVVIGRSDTALVFNVPRGESDVR